MGGEGKSLVLKAGIRGAMQGSLEVLEEPQEQTWRFVFTREGQEPAERRSATVRFTKELAFYAAKCLSWALRSEEPVLPPGRAISVLLGYDDETRTALYIELGVPDTYWRVSAYKDHKRQFDLAPLDREDLAKLGEVLRS